MKKLFVAPIIIIGLFFIGLPVMASFKYHSSKFRDFKEQYINNYCDIHKNEIDITQGAICYLLIRDHEQKHFVVYSGKANERLGPLIGIEEMNNGLYVFSEDLNLIVQVGPGGKVVTPRYLYFKEPGCHVENSDVKVYGEAYYISQLSLNLVSVNFDGKYYFFKISNKKPTTINYKSEMYMEPEGINEGISLCQDSDPESVQTKDVVELKALNGSETEYLQPFIDIETPLTIKAE